MRTTIRLDDSLLVEAKRIAAQSGKTLNAVLEDAIRESLARRTQTKPARPAALPVFKGSTLRPGVDLDDAAALLALMNEEDRL